MVHVQWNFYLSVCLSVCMCIYLWLCSPLLDLGRFFSFLILYRIGRTPWTGDQPVARPLPTHRTTHRINTQTSMPRLGFEPTIPVFERAKRVHALDRAATVIGNETSTWHKYKIIVCWNTTRILVSRHVTKTSKNTRAKSNLQFLPCKYSYIVTHVKVIVVLVSWEPYGFLLK
jgi:hypothetical protein